MDLSLRRRLLWTFLIVFCVGVRPSWAQVAPETLAKNLLVMIATQIDGEPQLGAGIIVGVADDKIYIATANHVVRRGSSEAKSIKVKLRWNRGDSVPAVLTEKFDSRQDVAILIIRNAARLRVPDLPFALIGKTSLVNRGSKVYSVGYLPNAEWFSLPDPVSVTSTAAGQFKFFDSGIAPGFSGGGLFNEQWQLVGMIQRHNPPLAEAIALTPLLELIAEWGYPVSLQPATAAPPPPAPVKPPPSQPSPQPLVPPSAQLQTDLGRLVDLATKKKLNGLKGPLDSTGTRWKSKYTATGAEACYIHNEPPLTYIGCVFAPTSLPYSEIKKAVAAAIPGVELIDQKSAEFPMNWRAETGNFFLEVFRRKLGEESVVVIRESPPRKQLSPLDELQSGITELGQSAKLGLLVGLRGKELEVANPQVQRAWQSKSGLPLAMSCIVYLAVPSNKSFVQCKFSLDRIANDELSSVVRKALPELAWTNSNTNLLQDGWLGSSREYSVRTGVSRQFPKEFVFLTIGEI